MGVADLEFVPKQRSDLIEKEAQIGFYLISPRSMGVYDSGCGKCKQKNRRILFHKDQENGV